MALSESTNKYFTSRTKDIKEEQKRINEDFNNAYALVKYKVQEVQHKTVLFIGRTRVGKSTIKSVLIDPRKISDEMTLHSVTREPIFTSYTIDDNHVVLDIIDTPGLFERRNKNSSTAARDNQTILNLIAKCLNREITQIHFICFVLSGRSIDSEDIQAINQLTTFLGTTMSQNACLIITQCESKNNEQREALKKELDECFSLNILYFQKGIHFFGAVNRDHWNLAADNVYDEFITICDYREKLIELFSSEIQPFQITESTISELQQKTQENMTLRNAITTQKQEMAALVQSNELLQQNLRDDVERSREDCEHLREALHKDEERYKEEIRHLQQELQNETERFKRTMEDLIQEKEQLRQRTLILEEKIKLSKEEKQQLQLIHQQEKERLNQQIHSLEEYQRPQKTFQQGTAQPNQQIDSLEENQRLQYTLQTITKYAHEDQQKFAIEKERLMKQSQELQQTFNRVTAQLNQQIQNLTVENTTLTRANQQIQNLTVENTTLTRTNQQYYAEIQQLKETIKKNSSGVLGLFYKSK